MDITRSFCIIFLALLWRAFALDTPSETSSDSCYVEGACPAPELRSTDKDGFTDNTGWTPSGDSCCDICDAKGTKKVNCFNPATCGNKQGDVNDWDYVILDQQWLPQFCSALEQGHDPTLTHLPGTKCAKDPVTATGLSIHGLWPNYINGFPQCCASVGELPQTLPDDILKEAQQEWVDPTISKSDSQCGWCSMWAHEMMKHGTCFATDIAGYFRAGLALLGRLQKETDTVNNLLNQATKGPIATSDVLQAYGSYHVQLLCDGKDANNTATIGKFLELRTCWNRTSSFDPAHADASDFYQIDCPAEAVGTVCPSYIMAAGGESSQLSRMELI